MNNEVWIAFKDSNTWFGYFLKKGFGHCYLITRDPYNWIIIDPLDTRMDINIQPYAASFDLPRYLSKKYNHRIIKIKLNVYTEKSSILSIIPKNCVSFVKYAAGLKFLSITPYQLYKKLIKYQKCEKILRNIDSISVVI